MPGPNAEESSKTKRDRRKLLAKQDAIESQITPEALQDCYRRICERMNRLAPLRVPVTHTFGLFDSNQNPKDVSERVSKIAESLRAGA